MHLIRESIALCSVLKLSDEELEPVAKACEVNSSFREYCCTRRTEVQISTGSCCDDPGS